MANEQTYIPLSEFLNELREKGLNIRVETYLDIKKIISASDYDIHALKYLICPLIAVSEEEQIIFYEIYDKHFRAREYSVVKQPAGPAKQKKKKYGNFEQRVQRQMFVTLSIFLLMICASLYALHYYIESVNHNENEFQVDLPENIESTEDDLLKDFIPNENTPEKNRVSAKDLIPFKKFINPDISYMQLKSPWWHENGFLFKCWIIIAIAAFFIAIEIYLMYSKKLTVLRRKSKKQGPERSLIIDERIKVELSERFYSTSMQMRKRIESELLEIDMPATVDATIRNKGWMDLRFSVKTKPSEFLLLIDHSKRTNHQVAWFEYIIARLQKSDVHIDCLYYDHEMNSLWKNELSKPVNLNHLLYHYPDHRLIIFGDALSFFRNGQLSLWTEILGNWQHRAILTPRLPSEWDEKEKILAEKFILLTADMKGMNELMEYIETGKKSNPEDLKYSSEETKIDLNRPLKEIIFDLKIRYDESSSGKATLYSWIAGCCIYHNLSWDLTLYIGKLLSEPGNNLLTEENIEKLTRLSWFRRGKIPDQFRQYILDDCRTEQRQLMLIRKINELLIKNIPEDKTLLSYDHHMMNVIVTELMQDPEERKKKELMRNLIRHRENTRSEDGLVMSFLRKHRNPFLDKILSDKIKNILYAEGMPYKGFRNYIRAIVAAVIVGTPLAVFDLTMDYKEHKHFAYMSKSYCIDTHEKEACFRTHSSADIYNERPWAMENKSSDIYLAEALRADSSYVPAHINRFIKRYNMALNYSDQNASWYNPSASVSILENNDGYAGKILRIADSNIKKIMDAGKHPASIEERNNLYLQENKIKENKNIIIRLREDNKNALEKARNKFNGL
jgi:hypothetical protein